MNSDDSLPPSPSGPPLDRELEARIIACVLGEASAAEAAEIDRLCAESPELAELRRHLAETQDLITEALRPAPTDLRLAPERRARLFATLRASSSAEDAKLPPLATLPSRPNRRWQDWAFPAAACLALLGLLAAIVMPTAESSFGVAFVKSASSAKSELAFERAKRERVDAPAPTASPSASDDFFAREVTRGPEPQKARVDFQPASPTVAPSPSRPNSPPPPPAVATRSDSSITLGLDAKRTESSSGTFSAELRRRRSPRDTNIDGLSTVGGAVGAEQNQPATVAFSLAEPLAVAGQKADASGFADGLRAAAEPAPSDKITYGMAGNEYALGAAVVPATPRPALAKELSDSFAKDADLSHRYSQVAQDRNGGAVVAAVPPSSTFIPPADIQLAGRIELKTKQETSFGDAERQKKREEMLARVAREGRPPAPSGEKTAETDAPAKPAPRPAPDASLRLEVPSADQPVSTFSLHVSDASFRIARAALARGEFPDPASIRPEEFYNAFDYGDPAPRADEPVAARVEQAAHPLLQQRNLLRVALRVPAAGRSAGQPLRLTLLLDTSGSMEREDRAATIGAALTQLATLLGPADRVTLIGFARTPRLLADRLPGDQASTLAQLAADTPPEGGTNLDAALHLAAELAVSQFDPAAQNRVVLLTDGAANLGDADPAALSARVVQLRQQGVAFDACGVGANGLDDGVLEALTRQGDGRYLLLDNAAEAGPAFARQLAGAFRPAAQNVKVQVRFNANRVPRYRLIGFEQHRLREEDFRNDKVDAAELAAAEAAVALYQIEVDPQGSGELGEVFVRFRETSTGSMVERSWPLPYDASASAFDRASPSLQLAGASALLAEKLQGGDTAAAIRLTDLDPIAAVLRARFVDQPRVIEFLDMLSQARRLSPE